MPTKQDLTEGDILACYGSIRGEVGDAYQVCIDTANSPLSFGFECTESRTRSPNNGLFANAIFKCRTERVRAVYLVAIADVIK